MHVIIGVDPHKASHTAVAVSDREDELALKKVRATSRQVEQLLAWAEPFETRTWAIEGADGTGFLLAQQLIATGEVVVDVPPTLAARTRLLGTGKTNKNDPNDALSVAVTALRTRDLRRVPAVGHAEVLRLLAKRNTDIGDHRCRLVSRLHSLLVQLAPGGIAKEINASDVEEFLAKVTPTTPAEQVRYDLAVELLDDIRRLDAQLKASHKRIRVAVAASATTVTDVFGVGPILAAMLIGYTGERRSLRQLRPLRRLQRHRARRVLLGWTHRAPRVAARQPPTQPRAPHGRDQPTPPSPLRRPRLLRTPRRGRQDEEGSHPLPQAPPQQRRLPAARRRRRPHPPLSGPGRTNGNDSKPA
jgi:hypothetical protein